MEKMYYSISEVSKMLDLAPHVLRYWETEFRELRPRKNRSGSRTYRDTDIELLRDIQKLLHKDRFTLEGAKIELQKRKESEPEFGAASKTVSESGGSDLIKADIQEIRSTLKEILDLLK